MRSILAILILITILLSGCAGAVWVEPQGAEALLLDDCDVKITDRITGDIYYTARGYHKFISSSRIELEEYYLVKRSAMGGIGTDYHNNKLYLVGNYKWEEIK